MRLPGVGSLWLPFDCDGRDQGWYTDGTSRMYVGRGLGTSILPIRFVCRPELALFTIRLTR